MKLPPKRPRPVTEAVIMGEIRNVLARMPDVVLYRNNVGILKDARGIPLRYGLAIGSADLIGSLTFKGDEPHGFRPFARSLAIEVKRPGERPTKEQVSWLAHVRAHGWVAEVATSVEEAVDIVERARRWEL